MIKEVAKTMSASYRYFATLQNTYRTKHKYLHLLLFLYLI